MLRASVGSGSYRERPPPSFASVEDLQAKRELTSRVLHGILSVAAPGWMFLCVDMVQTSSAQLGQHTTMGKLVEAAGVVLFGMQVLVLIHYARGVHALRIMRIAAAQLLLQTGVAIVLLTLYIFYSLGVPLGTCIVEERCATMLSGPLAPKRPQLVLSRTFSVGTFNTVSVHLQGRSAAADERAEISEAQGLAVQVLEPLSLSYSSSTKVTLCASILLYALAVAAIVLHIWRYRTLGHPHRGQWMPPWMTLQRLSGVAVLSVAGLVVLLTVGCFLHPDTVYAMPLLLGVGTFCELSLQWHSTLPTRSPRQLPYSTWRKRRETLRAVARMLSITYIAGLCFCLVACGEAQIWPSSLDSQGILVVIVAVCLHVVLSLGYALSVHTHLGKAQLEDLNALAPPPPEPSAPQGGGGGSECVVCMDSSVSALLLPCGHLCTCHQCARQLMERGQPLCPLCRESVDDVVRVYAAD